MANKTKDKDVIIEIKEGVVKAVRKVGGPFVRQGRKIIQPDPFKKRKKNG